MNRKSRRKEKFFREAKLGFRCEVCDKVASQFLSNHRTLTALCEKHRLPGLISAPERIRIETYSPREFATLLVQEG
jgi:hypothetical protein